MDQNLLHVAAVPEDSVRQSHDRVRRTFEVEVLQPLASLDGETLEHQISSDEHRIQAGESVVNDFRERHGHPALGEVHSRHIRIAHPLLVVPIQVDEIKLGVCVEVNESARVNLVGDEKCAACGLLRRAGERGNQKQQNSSDGNYLLEKLWKNHFRCRNLLKFFFV